MYTLLKLLLSAGRDQDTGSGGFGHQEATASTGSQHERLPWVSTWMPYNLQLASWYVVWSVTRLPKVEGCILCTPYISLVPRLLSGHLYVFSSFHLALITSLIPRLSLDNVWSKNLIWVWNRERSTSEFGIPICCANCQGLSCPNCFLPLLPLALV